MMGVQKTMMMTTTSAKAVASRVAHADGIDSIISSSLQGIKTQQVAKTWTLSLTSKTHSRSSAETTAVQSSDRSGGSSSNWGFDTGTDSSRYQAHTAAEPEIPLQAAFEAQGFITSTTIVSPGPTSYMPLLSFVSNSSGTVNSNSGPGAPNRARNHGIRTVAAISGTAGVVLFVLLVICTCMRQSLTSGSTVRLFATRRKMKRSIHKNVDKTKSCPESTLGGVIHIRSGSYDTETATQSSGSHYESDSSEKPDDDPDIRDARTGYMQRDNGEWLESWRRSKEKAFENLRQGLPLATGPPSPTLSLEKGVID